MISVKKDFPKPAAIRMDIARIALLAVITAFLWCSLWNRWTVASWQTPLEYISDPARADVLNVLAWIRGARDGHISPLFFNNVPELGRASYRQLG